MNATSHVPTFMFLDFYTDAGLDHLQVEKYLNIEFLMIEKDWTVRPPSVKYTDLKHRKCKRSDFSKRNLELYKKFEPFNVVFCLDDVNQIYLKGDATSSWKNKYI